MTVRILTFNIHHGEGPDRRLDLERVAHVIRDAGADLVALQEVDVGAHRSGGVDQAAALGRLTGLHAGFAKALDFDGGAYGVAVLSRAEPQQTRAHALPADPGHEPRAAAEVTVRVGGNADGNAGGGADDRGGVLVRFVSLHLDHRSGALRRRQVAALTAALEASDEDAEQAPDVTILAGDFNARPDSDLLSGLAPEWTDPAGAEGPPTFPSAQPRTRIDYVLFRKTDRVRSTRSGVIEATNASDHRPVWAVLEVAGP